MILKDWFLALIPLVVMTANAAEPTRPNEDFMLVLREGKGENKQVFGFKPSAPGTATLSDGKTITLNSAWFDLIGDMHVRFVFDGEVTMQNLSADEFAAFGLTPEAAAEIALDNIKKRYGKPKARPMDAGIMIVAGESPDLDSSYFLDRDFWDKLLAKNPQGVVVGVPARGGLVYAPVSDEAALAALEGNIHSFYEQSGKLRVSSALYLYKDGKWTVYRAPK